MNVARETVYVRLSQYTEKYNHWTGRTSVHLQQYALEFSIPTSHQQYIIFLEMWIVPPKVSYP